MVRSITRHSPGARRASSCGSRARDAPLTRRQASEQLRLEIAQRAAQHGAEVSELAVVRENLHHHLEVGNEAHWAKRQPVGRNSLVRIGGLHLPPQPLGRALLGVDQARHSLLPPATRPGLEQAQRVLQHAARGGLAAAEAQRDAVLDVIAFPRRRLEMAAEQLEHPLRVARGRELREIRIGREAARAHPRELARHPHRLAHRSKSPAGCPRLSSYRRRYRPLRAISSLCVPRSRMRPSSSRSTKSASVLEGRSCVIMRQVLPAIRRSSAWRTVASLSTSRPVIGSSRIRIGALRMRARAMAMRCRCPPDKVAPRSPMTVSYPSSSWRMNSCALAALAAAMISSAPASGRPYAIFSRMVAPNSNDCWSTSPIWRRSDSRRYWRMSTPSTRIAPSWGSYRRRIKLTMVDLPAPDAPTKASRCPGATLKETCRSTSLPSP